MDWIYMVLFVVLIFFSAFFSSAETALVSLNPVRLKHKASRKDRRAKALLSLLDNPEAFFSTLLIGNNLVNVALASLATVMSTRWVHGGDEWVLLVSTFVTTMVLLTFGEILPKAVAYRYRDRLAMVYYGPIRFFYLLFFPAVKFFSLLSHFFVGRGHGSSRNLSLGELKHLLASDVDMISQEPDTLRMVYEIIDLADRDVKSVMTPRPDMEAVLESEGLAGVRRVILEKRLSTVPVFRDNMDHIIGVVSAKHLVAPLLSGKFENLTLADVMVKPIFVSEYSSLRYALNLFRRQKTHFGIVVDEYGATLGLITQADIFQNVLGNLSLIAAPVQRISRCIYRINGNLAVEEANALLPVEVTERKDYTTVAGFFLYHYGKMPEKGARLRVNDVLWVVEKIESRRIEKLKIILNPGKNMPESKKP